MWEIRACPRAVGPSPYDGRPYSPRGYYRARSRPFVIWSIDGASNLIYQWFSKKNISVDPATAIQGSTCTGVSMTAWVALYINTSGPSTSPSACPTPFLTSSALLGHRLRCRTTRRDRLCPLPLPMRILMCNTQSTFKTSRYNICNIRTKICNIRPKID
jgi:hypothetical protein